MKTTTPTETESMKKEKATKAILRLAEKFGGEITPEIVLDEARKKSSPLHSHFCWDNNKAAEEFRKIQAAGLIRRVRVTITNEKEESIRVRAFINVNPTRNDGENPESVGAGIYVPVNVATLTEDYNRQMIENCKRDSEAFRRKYSMLSEASRIIKEMEHFEMEFSMD